MSEIVDSNFSQTLKENGSLGNGMGRRQMSIFYAGQVMVLDDFPPDKAMEIMMLAGVPLPDLPMARKASLVRFLEKRKERLELINI
ncbi:hypothetical protein L1987_14077 [Smallanthus sonchifolius]|uniref:Uncharacterized protein n=1 Tax=Smallanthus sonchifolius TaxID=185202 RepID=A0ACB9J5A3_9ASTR|nr:hypothetical protein L1987_14077 [Smallanthus sonchifolius]